MMKLDRKAMLCLTASAAMLLGLPSAFAQEQGLDDPVLNPTMDPAMDPATDPAIEPAPADPFAQPELPTYDEPARARGGMLEGTAIFAGGGVTGFTHETMRGATDVGGAYGVRLAMGNDNVLGTELGYVGTTQNLDILGTDDGQLYSNGLDGSLRWNLVPGAAVKPYVLGGVGWRRYDIVTENATTGAFEDDDNVFEIPTSVGVSTDLAGFVLDLRGTFRAVFNEDVAGDADLHNWGATLNAGYEF